MFLEAAALECVAAAFAVGILCLIAGAHALRVVASFFTGLIRAAKKPDDE